MLKKPLKPKLKRSLTRKKLLKPKLKRSVVSQRLPNLKLKLKRSAKKRKQLMSESV